MQGSVSRGILGGRIRTIEEEVLQMLRVSILTGLSEDEQIVEERRKEGGREGRKFNKEVKKNQSRQSTKGRMYAVV